MAAGRPQLQIMDSRKRHAPIVDIGARYAIYYSTLIKDSSIANNLFKLELEKVSLRKSTEPSELTDN